MARKSAECNKLMAITSLHRACQNGHLAVIQYLVGEQGAQVDQSDEDGDTPLHWACTNGHLAVVQYLVEEHGVQVDPCDNKGDTPLHCGMHEWPPSCGSISGRRAWRAT